MSVWSSRWVSNLSDTDEREWVLGFGRGDVYSLGKGLRVERGDGAE